ncbi:hypothetical protein FRC08_001515 [Ceratobasidium sp. 394]|nr:hypothetical protein FRC08_001515 [Ceratobasidium sp. 394]
MSGEAKQRIALYILVLSGIIFFLVWWACRAVRKRRHIRLKPLEPHAPQVDRVLSFNPVHQDHIIIGVETGDQVEGLPAYSPLKTTERNPSTGTGERLECVGCAGDGIASSTREVLTRPPPTYVSLDSRRP